LPGTWHRISADPVSFHLAVVATDEPWGATRRMSVSPSFRIFVLEQLGRSGVQVRGQSMFGGVGIYAGELFFALLADDTLYFKVDDSNRPDFEARGLRPFRPYGEGSEGMHYFRVPDDLLEDPEELRRWAEKAIGVARQARRHRSSRGGG
jgi:DNA transformation protein